MLISFRSVDNMPKPKATKSLEKTCLDVVLNTYFPIEEEYDAWTSFSRPLSSFRKSLQLQRILTMKNEIPCIYYFLLASCKLEQITNALKCQSHKYAKSAKQISMLLTQNSRALDLSFMKEIVYGDFCHMLCFASSRCPVLRLIIQAVL